MSYYHNLITERSWQFLQTLKRQYNFILIGGWAVYLYSKALKSKDIDFICDYQELQKLKSNYDLYKNDRLKKYEIHQGEFDIDIYVPFFSNLGIPVEKIEKNTQIIEGFKVPAPEVLLILKQTAWLNRRNSLKGEKDKIDIIALLKSGISLRRYKNFLKHYQLISYQKELQSLLKTTHEVPELQLNRHQYAKICFKYLETI